MNVRKANGFLRYAVGVTLVVGAAAVTFAAVRRGHRPGQLDVVTAQAMDMSAMRPPVGAAPVELAIVRHGSLGNTVTYTGTVVAFNTQDISPRVTGLLVSLPVYPGDAVRAGQLLAQLDTSESGAKSEQASAEARSAEANQENAELNHHQHHRAALDQAAAEIDVATEGVSDAEAEARAAQDGVSDAVASVQSATANAAYWKTEIAREKSLADAGAASQQEYQNELSQAQSADAALDQARAKRQQALSMVSAAQAKIRQAQSQVASARAMQRMAAADLVLAQGEERQAAFGAVAARAAERQAAIVQGYSRIVSPVAGVVTERPISPGTLVQPGTLLLRVAEIDRVRVQAHVAVGDLVGIRRGSPVQIIVKSADGRANAQIDTTVSAVFPSANETSRTAIVEAVIDNSSHRLLPGQFVTLHLTGASEPEALIAPAAAVVYDGGAPYLWVAQGQGKPAAAPTEYECAICHMHYSAADAKKNHFKDPMDGGALTPVAAPPASLAAMTGATVKRVPITIVASDSASVSFRSAALSLGDQVVVHGQADLTDGARIVVTRWGADGPSTLPNAASSLGGVTRYRCEKCGMTYSEADAKKNGFIDPMDGGKLTPIMEGKR